MARQLNQPRRLWTIQALDGSFKVVYITLDEALFLLKECGFVFSKTYLGR